MSASSGSGAPIRSRSSSTTATSLQHRLGAASSVPRATSTRPGSATVAPIARRPWARTSSSAPRTSSASRSSTAPASAARLSAASTRPVAGAAGEVGRLHAQVVDVDLEPQRDRPVAADVDHVARAARGPARLDPALQQQAEVDQLARPAATPWSCSGPVSWAIVARERGPRSITCSEHHAEVVPAHRARRRELARRFWCPTAESETVAVTKRATLRHKSALMRNKWVGPPFAGGGHIADFRGLHPTTGV